MKSLSETHINYADETARSFCTNPSWFSFHGGRIDYTLTDEPKCKDYFKDATAFLERHFGRTPTVRASPATQQRLQKLQLNALVVNNEGHIEEEKPEAVVWHTWLLEEVKLPPSQCAEIIEWVAPQTEALRISNRSWHFQDCMAWRLIVSHKNELANCYCHRIKTCMDRVHNLGDLELQPDKSSVDFPSLVPELTEKLLTTTDVLKKLNELLDLQEKSNRRYKHQLMMES